jgi:hypothetical protein
MPVVSGKQEEQLAPFDSDDPPTAVDDQQYAKDVEGLEALADVDEDARMDGVLDRLSAHGETIA